MIDVLELLGDWALISLDTVAACKQDVAVGVTGGCGGFDRAVPDSGGRLHRQAASLLLGVRAAVEALDSDQSAAATADVEVRRPAQWLQGL